jgi:hypothetical protein
MEENRKILNLVCDDWDEQNLPKINGAKHYGDRFFWDGSNFIYFYLNNVANNEDKFEMKFNKLEDVYQKPDEKFYYILNHSRSDLWCLHNIEQILPELNMGGNTYELPNPNKIPTSPISDELEIVLKECSNFNIIFLTEHEPDTERGFVALNENIISRNIDGRQIFVLNNNSKLDDYKQKYKSLINVRTLSFIPYSSTEVLIQAGGCEWKEHKLNKFFMCFNKSPKPHRYTLLALLMKHNLLDTFNWSLVPSWDYMMSFENYGPFLSEEDIWKMRWEIWYLQNLKIKRSDFEEDKGWFKEHQEPDTSELPNWMRIPELTETYKESYVNVVTESEFSGRFNVIHISEKSFRPFYYYQYPMILATQGHISKMREKYGFDFYDDIIDHSYDNEPDDKKRMMMFFKEIQRLSNNIDPLIKYYERNRERFEENKKRVESILKNETDYHFFKSLIDINVKNLI